MTCDVIMPAYNQERTLPRVITALAEQQLAAGDTLRLILADDGSTDATIAVATDASRSSRLACRVVSGPHCGAAAARNRALQHSDADVVLLLGADIVLRPQAVFHHLALHKRAVAPTDAALGMVRWVPALPPTPFMEWMIHGGPQNNFDALLGAVTAPAAEYFFASHLSCKRQLLQEHSFNESFTGYGWEDLELGRRLQNKGCTLFILHAAIGLHDHAYTAADIFHRQAAAGRQLPQYQQLHTAVSLLPRRSFRGRIKQHVLVRTGIHAALKHLLGYTGATRATPRLFAVAAATEFWRGITQQRP